MFWVFIIVYITKWLSKMLKRRAGVVDLRCSRPFGVNGEMLIEDLWRL